MAAPEEKVLLPSEAKEPDEDMFVTETNKRDPTIPGYYREKEQHTQTELKDLKSKFVQMEQLMISFQSETRTILETINIAVMKEDPNELDGSIPGPMAMKKTQSLDESADAWKTATDILQSQFNEHQKGSKREITSLKSNNEDLNKEIVRLEERANELNSEASRFKHEKELLEQKLREYQAQIGEPVDEESTEFPSNETVIHNLLIAQIEFYFSDHHLKRDKPLMQKLTEEPVGFIAFDEVLKFPKVRTLGQDPDVVQKAVLESKYLKAHQDEEGKVTLVGRIRFNPPRAQEFPFRRTVFIYGIPPGKSEEWIRMQFDCFGKIEKVKFDSGPHTSPRKVGARLLQKEPSRVTRLHFGDKQHTEFTFSKARPENFPGEEYTCHGCNKLKKFEDGFYESRQPHARMQASKFCIQCSAKKAEENKKFYQKLRHTASREMQIEPKFGIDHSQKTDVHSFVTCLIVYESQRQASKCVYVRSRLGIEGCFATHFHNYTRHKKEICQGIELVPGPPTPMAKTESSFRLVEDRNKTAHRRRGGARVESGGLYKGINPPAMSRHRSAPTMHNMRQESSNTRFQRF